MSTSTLVRHGEIHNIGVPVTILPNYTDKEVEYNPGLCYDPQGNLWISLRACTTDYKKISGLEHPVHYMNHLYVGILEKKALNIINLKEVKPEAEYPGFQWDIEDIRLFWRDDGLHAIGVILPIRNGNYRTCQAEVLIDYQKGTYKLIKDYGQPKGQMEKNWSPPETATPKFDFAYSLSEIVKDGKVYGSDNHLAVHNGTKLLPYKDGYIQLCHIVCGVGGERTYAHVAVLRDQNGYGTHISQLFHFNVGWRERLQETIEFASDMVWSGDELLVGLGVKDEATGFARIPVSKFIWDETTDIIWYRWRWSTPPNRKEIILPRSNRPDWK